MAYLERLEENGSSRYRLMREQVHLASAVCAGEAVVDPNIFYAMPHRDAGDVPVEADNCPTAFKDAVTAFSAALYGPVYGPASERQTFREGDTIAQSLDRWSSSVANAYDAHIRPANFRKIVLEGGLWHVLADEYAPDGPGGLRSRLEQATNLNDFRKDHSLLTIVKKAHPYFKRTPPGLPLSHIGSHVDDARFANSVLHIGEKELKLTQSKDKESLLINSLPRIRRLALLDILGANTALTPGFLYDEDTGLYKREYLTLDAERLRVGPNMNAIQDAIETELPDIATYNHRGCPVLYRTTRFEGKQTPVFSVMDATILRMYRSTGALSISELRYLPFVRMLTLPSDPNAAAPAATPQSQQFYDFL